MFRRWTVLHAASWLGCFHLSLRFSMILALDTRFGTLGPRLGLFRGAPRPARQRRSIQRLDELGDAGLDRLVSGQLRLGVKLEVALGPVKCVDHGVVSRLPVSLSVKKMAEEKVQRDRLTVSIADGKGTCGALTLSSLQKRSKGNFRPMSRATATAFLLRSAQPDRGIKRKLV